MNSEEMAGDRQMILIVEDSPTQTEELKYLLEKHYFLVETAANGQDALALLEQLRPLTVISDIVMPGMDGYELCRRIKGNEELHDLPVILLTSLSDPEDVITGLECGADFFIMKPYHEQFLLSRVQHILANRNLGKDHGAQMGLEIFFRGKKYFINSDRLQILNLLLSTYETAIQKSQELIETQHELKMMNEQLEETVTQRTMALQEEIAERRRAEEGFQQVKNHLANIIDSMPAILVGMNQDETISRWNREAERATGISATEAVGQPIGALLPEFAPSIKNLRAQCTTSHPVSLEKLIILRDNERHFYDLMLYPLVASNVEGAVLRIEDVTERARLQELMVQTEKMMSIGGLAAGMAHEINNPLGIINQAAQNIERRLTADIPGNREVAGKLGLDLELMCRYYTTRQVDQFIANIHEATARAARIVANMLQFSRQSTPAKQLASLAEIMNQAVELAASDYDLKKKYDFRGIELVREYDPTLSQVPMVTVEIEQLILNLLKNAAEAMAANPPEKRPRLILGLRKEENYAVLEVADNGPGMEERIRSRVFEPFFTTKEPGAGTGLGLSVSYMIVTNNHQGFMAVDSTPGAGARFTIRLPLGSGK